MNYRHAYHAGNFADVFKHVVLVNLIETFKAKPAPFCYFETHAGRGLYDLAGEAAQKTREADDGVARVLALDPPPLVLRRYVELVRGLNAPDGTLRRYPGSPLLASQLLRDGDSAIACELEPGEARALRALMRHGTSFHVHQRDGYEALRALVPPVEKRGLVLIDPPFEVQLAEFGFIQTALGDALARWPGGRYAVWYPIKLRRDRNGFLRWLRQRCRAPWLVAELLVHPDNTSLRLNGCGLAIINPPWRFERTLDAILDALRPCLARDGAGVKWIDSGAGNTAAG